jgi:peptidyl-prolyl cis-trans isomerase SurA
MSVAIPFEPMEVRVSLTLNASNLFLNTRTSRCFVFLQAVVLASALHAQVVKAPRYQGGVDAPTPVLNLPPVPPAITPHGTVVEDIVVRVNDQIISRSDVIRQQQQLEQAAAQGNIPPAELAGEQKNMLRDMIDQQLLLSRAKELGLNADADVIRRLDDIRKQNHFDSMDELERAARKEGVNFEDFKAQIRNQLLTQMVVRDEVGRHLQMTQAEAQKYYDDHKQDFVQPEQVKLSEILIPTPDNPTPEQIAQAEAKANDVKAQVAKGADFADLARKYSGGPSAAQGGDLGLFKRGALAKVLEDQTFGLKAGESTAPIRTRQGFVILKVTQHDAEGPAPFNAVVPQIEEAMYMQQMQPALRTYLTKLREDFYVDIQPGFVDSGASPSQTKPIFTAYAPPPVKKKEDKQKARFDRNGPATKAVISSPDTTGGRTVTGADAPRVDPSTGLASISMPAKPNGNPGKHLKREKIRFGQAPRTSIASDPEEAGTATAPASGTIAPGAVMASNGTQGSSNLDDNPLTPRSPVKQKTRFAAKEAEVKEKKVLDAHALVSEKKAARPDAASAEEKASAKEQAAPLGLAGDTSKKPAKPKRVKGQPKNAWRISPRTPSPPLRLQSIKR